jgi:hypothetical protein
MSSIASTSVLVQDMKLEQHSCCSRNAQMRKHTRGNGHHDLVDSVAAVSIMIACGLQCSS